MEESWLFYKLSNDSWVFNTSTLSKLHFENPACHKHYQGNDVMFLFTPKHVSWHDIQLATFMGVLLTTKAKLEVHMEAVGVAAREQLAEATSMLYLSHVAANQRRMFPTFTKALVSSEKKKDMMTVTSSNYTNYILT